MVDGNDPQQRFSHSIITAVRTDLTMSGRTMVAMTH
jgi:hypothetical protein